MALELFKIGDRLSVKIDDSSRNWGAKRPANGTMVELVEVTRSKTYYGRINNFGLEPGIYSIPSGVLVKDQAGNKFELSQYDVELPDGELERRMGPLRDEYGVYRGSGRVKVAELPETPLYELDKVVYLDSVGTRCIGTVQSISYLQLRETTNNGHPFPAYTIEIEPGVATVISPDKVIEVERGKLWKYLHGEPLEWANVEEEAKFYALQLGQSTELRNPATRNFSWSIEEAVAYLRDGHADLIQGGRQFFGGDAFIVVRKVHDRALAERIRRYILESWDQPATA